MESANKKVWCFDCASKAPVKMTYATHFVFIRKEQYGDDNRVLGVCNECRLTKNQFQRKYAEKITDDNISNSNLVRKSI